ncbi:hypothetical protein LTR17_018834 [Elasticomyces elasticus]|nr:hypothetical protein LTR17_018834 [Elasticomyces elasticus]
MATFASLARLLIFLLATVPFGLGLPTLFLAIHLYAFLWCNIFPTYARPASPRQFMVRTTICLRLLSTATTIVGAIVADWHQQTFEPTILHRIWIVYKLYDLWTTSISLHKIWTGAGRNDHASPLSRMLIDSVKLVWHSAAVGNDICYLHQEFRGLTLLDLGTGNLLELVQWEEAAVWALSKPMFDKVKSDNTTSVYIMTFFYCLRASIWMRQRLWKV